MIGALLAQLGELDVDLAAQLRAAAARHGADHDVVHQCRTFAATAERRVDELRPIARAYAGEASWSSAVVGESDVLLDDLRTLHLRLEEAAITWTIAEQAAKATRDAELVTLATESRIELEMQAKWFTTRIKTAAPQALVVPR